MYALQKKELSPDYSFEERCSACENTASALLINAANIGKAKGDAKINPTVQEALAVINQTCATMSSPALKGYCDRIVAPNKVCTLVHFFFFFLSGFSDVCSQSAAFLSVFFLFVCSSGCIRCQLCYGLPMEGQRI